jgi:hypothetical protein
MKKYTVLIAAAALFFTGCNDEFLDREKPDEVTTETFWTSENDLKVWINTFYEYATGPRYHYEPTTGFNPLDILLGKGVSRGYDSHNRVYMFSDISGGDMASMNHSRINSYNEIRSGTNVPPTDHWDDSQRSGWWWNFLRPYNLFIENYQKVDLPAEQLEWYGGQAYLWRAWFYYDKVLHFGDVPLVLRELDVSDTTILFGPRDPREVVMAQVLEDINYACEHMPETYNNGSPGWMDKWSAYALKSRLCLFEGTWRKYHGGSDADMWLQEAASAAKYLMDNGGFSLYDTGNPETDYRFPYHQWDLTGNPEIIYWKRHTPGINTTGFHNYFHEYSGGFTRQMIEDYLCTDGLPINQSPLYMGDSTIEHTFMNRDPRMRQTTLHPEDGGPDATHINYRASLGPYQTYPQFPGQRGAGSNKTSTGYYVIKWYDDEAWNQGWQYDPSASIIFKLNEVLLNYAEAKAELGEMTQEHLDISINLLRDRAGMPDVELNNIVDDPRHDDMGVSDLLVEIRRERRIELAGEGFRWDDVRRWKIWIMESQKTNFNQGILWDDVAKTRYRNAPVNTSVDPATGKEYIDVYVGTNYVPQLRERNYLWPIPIWVLTQNPNLKQNPGWEYQ